MSPTWMLAALFGAIAMFAWTANRRWQLLKIGRPDERTDRVPQRLAALLRFGFGQARMPKYPAAGIAHIAVFAGFLILLLRSLILFGRGFDPHFALWILDESTPLGQMYSAAKDVIALVVIVGAGYFLYVRLFVKPKRITASREAYLILGIIITMMFADILYDAAGAAREARGEAVAWEWFVPVGSWAGNVLAGVDLSSGTLRILEHAGFWTHVVLVLVFLNLLPYSKHFHVITALPNVFLLSLDPPGRLRPIPDIEDRVGEDRPVGIRTIEDLTWKGLLDLYTCTECGRCTDNCPANRTGKLLSPKHLTLALRDHLYAREEEIIDGRFPEKDAHGEGHEAHPAGDGHEDGHGDGHGDGHDHGHDEPPAAQPPKPVVIERKLVDLVPSPIDPEVLWACTTCRACEEECPVFISYVDKIVDMRRDLVAYGKEMPPDLQKPFDGMERNGNPWNFARVDRTAWTEGLDVPILSEHEDAEILFWVGCAGSYDDRAKKIARSMVRLMKLAGVDFAILGEEESCTGDSARRAGNEYLFQMIAQANVEILNGHKVKKIVTICPHCFNTLAHEYPDFGLSGVEVIHHAVFLQQLIDEGRLVPRTKIDKKVVFHDSCYLGRYNDVYAPPRKVLSAIPGVTLAEALDAQGGSAAFQRGMCCGAGGAQYWKEEEKGRTRVNYERTDQLLASGAKVVASACPFCQTMLIDGIKAKDLEDVEQLDIAELLERAIDPDRPAGLPAAAPGDPPRVAPAAGE